MVGYALLDDQAEPDPESGLYKRRVFFLFLHDRDSLPGGLYREGAPGEAVDPRTIEVKKVGEKTPCQQSGPAAIIGFRSLVRRPWPRSRWCRRPTRSWPVSAVILHVDAV